MEVTKKRHKVKDPENSPKTHELVNWRTHAVEMKRRFESFQLSWAFKSSVCSVFFRQLRWFCADVLSFCAFDKNCVSDELFPFVSFFHPPTFSSRSLPVKALLIIMKALFEEISNLARFRDFVEINSSVAHVSVNTDNVELKRKPLLGATDAKSRFLRSVIFRVCN